MVLQSNVFLWGTTHPVNEDWPETLKSILLKIISFQNVEFNSVLINIYQSGVDWIPYHSDDEPELGNHPIIASYSIGVTRFFFAKTQT